MDTTEKYKLVACDVRSGSAVSERTPSIEGVTWLEVPGTRAEVGSYYQAVFVARAPESACQDLPDNCCVENRFIHITDLIINYRNGEEVIEVFHQEAEGGSPQKYTIFCQ